MRARQVTALLWLAILSLLLVQSWYDSRIRDLRPAIEEMPAVPSPLTLKAMAFGDEEFLFRHLGRWLQGVGDGGGRMRRLKEFDYDRVVDWLRALDGINADHAEYTHELAARYFGEVDIDRGRVRKIVDYLRTMSLRDPEREWPWLVWAAGKAQHPIADPALIKAIAHDLQSPELRSPRVPPWVRVLPAHLYHVAGDEADEQAALASVTPQDREAVEEEKRQLFQAILRFKQRQ